MRKTPRLRQKITVFLRVYEPLTYPPVKAFLKKLWGFQEGALNSAYLWKDLQCVMCLQNPNFVPRLLPSGLGSKEMSIRANRFGFMLWMLQLIVEQVWLNSHVPPACKTMKVGKLPNFPFNQLCGATSAMRSTYPIGCTRTCMWPSETIQIPENTWKIKNAQVRSTCSPFNPSTQSDKELIFAFCLRHQGPLTGHQNARDFVGKGAKN